MSDVDGRRRESDSFSALILEMMPCLPNGQYTMTGAKDVTESASRINSNKTGRNRRSSASPQETPIQRLPQRSSELRHSEKVGGRTYDLLPKMATKAIAASR